MRYGYILALRWRIDGVDSNPAKDLKNLKRCLPDLAAFAVV